MRGLRGFFPNPSRVRVCVCARESGVNPLAETPQTRQTPQMAFVRTSVSKGEDKRNGFCRQKIERQAGWKHEPA
jgi:hypothetical protein